MFLVHDNNKSNFKITLIADNKESCDLSNFIENGIINTNIMIELKKFTENIYKLRQCR